MRIFLYVYMHLYKCVTVSVRTYVILCNHVYMCVYACNAMSVTVLHVSTHQAIAGKHQRGALLKYLSQDHWSTSYFWNETNLQETKAHV